jgi:hypothetical protein
LDKVGRCQEKDYKLADFAFLKPGRTSPPIHEPGGSGLRLLHIEAAMPSTFKKISVSLSISQRVFSGR